MASGAVNGQDHGAAYDAQQGLDFARRLGGDPRSVNPLEWSVDWSDTPLPYKIYAAPHGVPLTGGIPDKLAAPSARSSNPQPKPEPARWIGTLLHYAYGLTTCRLFGPSGVDRELGEHGSTDRSAPVIRRPVASGGALYPAELYLYLRLDSDASRGVYHYDVAHHALVPLRYGNYDRYLELATGGDKRVKMSRAIALVSVVFWKNYFKYGDLAYRLGAQDAGVLVGQILTLSVRVFSGTSLRLRFLDVALDHLLGLQTTEESVYAMIFLPDVGKTGLAANRSPRCRPFASADELAGSIPAVGHPVSRSSRNVKSSPAILRMHRGSLMWGAGDAAKPLTPSPPEPSGQGLRTNLPDPSTGLFSQLEDVVRRRTSSGELFEPGGVSLSQLADILWHATRSLDLADLGSGGAARQELEGVVKPALYCVLAGVEGLPSGCYRYDAGSHQLVLLRSGDARPLLQSCLLLRNMNLRAVPVCLHPVAERNYGVDRLGNRGYRMQQMLVGILAGRIQLAATAVGLNAHPVLGFDVPRIDRMYGIADSPLTAQLQVPVARARAGTFIEGAITAGL